MNYKTSSFEYLLDEYYRSVTKFLTYKSLVDSNVMSESRDKLLQYVDCLINKIDDLNEKLELFNKEDKQPLIKKISVNLTEYSISQDKLTYNEIRDIAAIEFPYMKHQLLSIVYHNSKYSDSGTITPGQFVYVKDGMRITAVQTGNA